MPNTITKSTFAYWAFQSCWVQQQAALQVFREKLFQRYFSGLTLSHRLEDVMWKTWALWKGFKSDSIRPVYHGYKERFDQKSEDEWARCSRLYSRAGGIWWVLWGLGELVASDEGNKDRDQYRSLQYRSIQRNSFVKVRQELLNCWLWSVKDASGLYYTYSQVLFIKICTPNLFYTSLYSKSKRQRGLKLGEYDTA